MEQALRVAAPAPDQLPVRCVPVASVWRTQGRAGATCGAGCGRGRSTWGGGACPQRQGCEPVCVGRKHFGPWPTDLDLKGANGASKGLTPLLLQACRAPSPQGSWQPSSCTRHQVGPGSARGLGAHAPAPPPLRSSHPPLCANAIVRAEATHAHAR